MRTIARLAVLCIAQAAGAEDETGFALAPSLDALERFLPEPIAALRMGPAIPSRPRSASST